MDAEINEEQEQMSLEIKNLEAEREQLLKTLENFEQRRVDCECRLSKCRLSKYIEDRSNYLQLLQKLEKQHTNDSTGEIENLKGVIHQLDVLIDKLKQHLTDVENKKSSGSSEYVSLVPRFHDLENKHQQALKEIQQLKETVEELQKAGPGKKVTTNENKPLINNCSWSLGEGSTKRQHDDDNDDDDDHHHHDRDYYYYDFIRKLKRRG